MMRTRRCAALALVAVALCALPGAASASNWWWYSYPTKVLHLNKGHDPTLTLYNHATNGSWTAIEHARGDWSAASFAMDISNLNSSSADVEAWDGRWCANWSGLDTPMTNAYGANTAYSDGHVDHMWVQIDVCSTNGSYAYNANYQGTRMIACHELGHATAGEWEGTAEGAPGCVSATYDPGTDPSNPAWRSPSAHDLSHANHLWDYLH